jgi:hypothetical protein
MVFAPRGVEIQFFREFDPGSGRTLAACLTHASRTGLKSTPDVQAETAEQRVLISVQWRTGE